MNSKTTQGKPISKAEWESALAPVIGNDSDMADHLARFLFQLKSALESGPDGVVWARSTLRDAIAEIRGMSAPSVSASKVGLNHGEV